MFSHDEIAAAPRDVGPTPEQKARIKRRIFRRLAWERRANLTAVFLLGLGIGLLVAR